MRRIFGTVMAVTLTVVLLGMCFVSQAAAQCGSFVSSNVETIQPQLWEVQPQLTEASLTWRGGEGDHIVGFWKAERVTLFDTKRVKSVTLRTGEPICCSSCGTDNAAGSRFCNQCATSLGKLCPKCAFDNASAARFCSQCAAPLDGALPVRANAESINNVKARNDG
jgi:Double zinc ribbon